MVCILQLDYNERKEIAISLKTSMAQIVAIAAKAILVVMTSHTEDRRFLTPTFESQSLHKRASKGSHNTECPFYMVKTN